MRRPRPNIYDAELADTIEAERLRRRKRQVKESPYVVADAAMLETPEAQQLLLRLGTACECVAADIDRVEYVTAVALDVLAAQAHPRGDYWRDRNAA